MDKDAAATQRAVQLVGPDKLKLNTAKPVVQPGPHQVLCRVEAVGLCFSDLKLLKQFSGHARKSEIIDGIDPQVLNEIPSYVPGEAPTVPGHEAVVRIAAVGDQVKAFKPGQRYLVQTDYRWLPTESSNAAFGYNLEGALQEYVIMDERVITSPEGESLLIPASEKLSAAAVALVEPWACVEDAYVSAERRTLKAGGRMLIVAEADVDQKALTALLEGNNRPAQISWVAQGQAHIDVNIPIEQVADLSELGDADYDDVIYFGSNPETLEALFCHVAAHGLLNIVLCGGSLGRDVVTYVGRVHYGGIRIVGTPGADPAAALAYIPATGEIRPGDQINVIGAGGPMGVMHVIRNICQGVKDITVFAGDLDDDRLTGLTRIASPLATENGVGYQTYNPTRDAPNVAFDYVALMAPVPALVAAAVKTAAPGAIINIFAGIPATVTGEIDLDNYIRKQMYFIGTSGSVLADMKVVLAKVESGRLDTNLSVAAVSGLEGATEGIRAVENQLIPGKIIVYPACPGLGLVELADMQEKLPEVAACLAQGIWNPSAEKALLAKHQA